MYSIRELLLCLRGITKSQDLWSTTKFTPKDTRKVPEIVVAMVITSDSAKKIGLGVCYLFKFGKSV